MNKYRIHLLTLAAIVGVIGFYIIHKKDIEFPKKIPGAASSLIKNQK